MAVSKRTRFEVLRRDAHTCRYCKSTTNPLTVDHVVPVSLGGSDKPDNLVAACSDCNAGKASSNPDAAVVAQVGDDALRWAAAMAVAASDAVADLSRADEYADQFDEAWTRWGYGEGESRTELVRHPAWRASLHRWYAAGLPIEILLACIPAAMSPDRIQHEDRWRYFCGVVWGRLREIQDAALTAGVEPSTAAPDRCGHCLGCLQNDPDACAMQSEDEDVGCLMCGDPNCLYRLGWTASEYLSWTDGYKAGKAKERRSPTYSGFMFNALSKVCDAPARAHFLGEVA